LHKKGHQVKFRKQRLDVYQHVTDTIIAAIEAGPGAFTMPWHRSGMSVGLPRNALTAKAYQGINTIALWAVSELRRYPTTIYATYRQWEQMGAHVKEGEKGSLVVFYKEYAVDPDPGNPEDDGRRRTLRHSHVFNASQVDGYEIPEQPQMPPLARHPEMERLIAASGVEVRIGGDSAYYSPASDYVQLPNPDCFQQADAADRTYHFESTAAHELVHATGHPNRLSRDLTGRFGDGKYGAEELIAELGACYICAELGLAAQPRIDHAQYVAHWLRLMKQDNRAIFAAAARAAEASRYLLNTLHAPKAG
jgi:antirestriction protein ArdC